jgi:hypothetical protein
MILHYYGESADPRAFERALAADPELRRRYDQLCRALASIPDLEVPEPSPDLAARVWRRMRPDLPPHRSLLRRLGRLRFDFSLRPAFALAAAASLALALGFLLGRGGRLEPSPAEEAAFPGLSTAARERLLLASVSDHFGGSERLLANISNASDTDPATLEEQRRWAASLAASNRLYRSAAERSGQRRIVALLDELEPLLLEIANSSAESAADLSAAQERIEEKDLLFKLRVSGERLERSTRPAPRATSVTNTI